jgi:hypothetical protein
LFYSLNATATRLIEKVDIPTNDLNLSDELRRTLALLRDILETHSTSMIPFESKRVDFQQIVYSIVDPLLQMCSLSAAKLGVIEMAVYLVNCVSAIRTTLAVFAFTDEKIEMLEGQVCKKHFVYDQLVLLRLVFSSLNCIKIEWRNACTCECL